MVSGDRLRYCGIHGEYNQLMLLLTGGANPCSTNDDGLSALHMAVWNGHVPCVGALCTHHQGKGKEGHGESCLNLQSSGGFTALHLAAMDGIDPDKTIPVLLLCGADTTLLDRMGRTAYEVALAYERWDCAELLQCPQTISEDYRAALRAKHRLDYSKFSGLPPSVAKIHGAHEELFVEPLKREAPLPRELKISERRIMPSFNKCMAARRSATVVRALCFLTDQGMANEARRRKLADLAQTTEHAWRAGNAKAGPPERELIMSRPRRSKKKERKWRLVPIISFDT